MFSLSFQSEGHNQNFFHLRNIQKDVTVKTDLDGRIQKCCFRAGQFGISKKINTNRTFATFGQSRPGVRCEQQIPDFWE